MKHIEEEQFWAYADELLPGAEKAALETHLRACADCRESWLFIQHVHQGMGEESLLETPSLSFSQNVMAQVMSLNERVIFKPLLSRVWRWSAIGLFALLSIAIVVFGPQTAAEMPFLSKYLSQFNEFFPTSSLNSSLLIPIICVGVFWLLFVSDRFLLPKLLKRKN